MKKLLPLLAVTLLLFTACKKNDTKTTELAGDSSWTLAGVSYKAAVTYKSTTSQGDILINFWDATPSQTVKVNAVSLSFKTDPTSAGTYQLVGIGTTPSGKQFQLSAGTKDGGAYTYIGTSPVDVTVTITNGKIKAVIPEISLKSAVSGAADAKFSGTLSEIN